LQAQPSATYQKRRKNTKSQRTSKPANKTIINYLRTPNYNPDSYVIEDILGYRVLSYIYTQSVLNNLLETAMGEPHKRVAKWPTIRADVIATNGNNERVQLKRQILKIIFVSLRHLFTFILSRATHSPDSWQTYTHIHHELNF